MEHPKAVDLKSTGIFKLRDMMDWDSFRPLMEDISCDATRDWSKGGKPPFDPVFILKVLVLQKYINLSDDATEEQIFDRFSFRCELRTN